MLLKGVLHHRRPPAIPTAEGNLRFRESVRYLGVILQGSLKIDGDSKQGEAALSYTRPTWRTGMGIPGSKLHRLVQGALPEHLCIRSAWLGKKTQATSPETAANGTEAGVEAYATASTDCLPAVAGMLPIDLYI